MNASQKASQLWNFSMKKPSAINPAPKLHQVIEKAFMPTEKNFTVVWLSIKRWRDRMNSLLKVSPFWISFNEKTFEKNLSPKWHDQRKSLLLPCFQALKDGDIKWILPKRCPHFNFFSREVDTSMNDGSALKVSNTGPANWKIRFNASLASCVSIESTHAPLLVLSMSYLHKSEADFRYYNLRLIVNK